MPDLDPSTNFTDANGYEYVETADWWKKACETLPCFSLIRWPDYSTKVIEDVIDGNPVVIQLWIGWCQKFMGIDEFPGGIGAEVGIYRRIEGKVPGPIDEALPAAFAHRFLVPAERLFHNKLWWAYPELNAEIEFELINPETGETFFKAGPERTYWLNRWMNPESYQRYKAAQDGDVPWFSVNYLMKYKINGKEYEWV
ncbi:MAG: hypothetical protein ABIP75_11225 [Pyrinomonadaceae bacterium]